MAKIPKKATKLLDDAINPKLVESMEAVQERVKAERMESLDQKMYEHFAGQVDNANQPTLAERTLLNQQLAEAQEETRRAHISPNFLKADYNAQARTPEEYRARVPQLRNSLFARDAVENSHWGSKVPSPSEWEESVRKSYQRFLEEQDSVTLDASTVRWSEGTVYTRRAIFGDDVARPDDPVVFWHIDKNTDPRLEDLNFIQFDPAANEFGLHIGTMNATTDILNMDTIGGNRADNLNAQIQAFRESFENLWEESMNPDLAEEAVQLLDEVDPLDIFESVLNDTRTQMFLRAGESYKAPKDSTILEDIINTFDEALAYHMHKQGMMPSTAGAAQLKHTLKNAMRWHYDPTTYPLALKLKQGLFVPDLGNSNTAAGFAEALLDTGEFPREELLAIMNMPNERGNLAFRSLLEDRGYDHLTYINVAEDPGVLSIVAWKPDTVENLYYPRNARNNKVSGGKAAISAAMAPLFAALEQAREE